MRSETPARLPVAPTLTCAIAGSARSAKVAVPAGEHDDVAIRIVQPAFEMLRVGIHERLLDDVGAQRACPRDRGVERVGLEPEQDAVAVGRAGSWYLTIVSVYAEFRGQGLGSALLNKAEEIARLAEAPQISLIVEANAGALKLYLRYGFREWTRRPYIPFPGSTDEGDWVLLKKEIAR